MKLVTLWVLLCAIQVSFSQNPEASQIRAQREGSNAALRHFDEALNASFLTEDVSIVTGAGTLIFGKEELLQYAGKLSGPRKYWVRSPEEVIVNPQTLLAWETGTWKGYEEHADAAFAGGRYAAQWTKASGTWLIRSQLFVTLPE